MPPHKLIQDAEAEVQKTPVGQGLKFSHTWQSEVFRSNGSRVCWMLASHDVLQIQVDNVSNAPKGVLLEPVYEDFSDPVKAAEYILSLV